MSGGTTVWWHICRRPHLRRGHDTTRYDSSPCSSIDLDLTGKKFLFLVLGNMEEVVQVVLFFFLFLWRVSTEMSALGELTGTVEGLLIVCGLNPPLVCSCKETGTIKGEARERQRGGKMFKKKHDQRCWLFSSNQAAQRFICYLRAEPITCVCVCVGAEVEALNCSIL